LRGSGSGNKMKRAYKKNMIGRCKYVIGESYLAFSLVVHFSGWKIQLVVMLIAELTSKDLRVFLVSALQTYTYIWRR